MDSKWYGLELVWFYSQLSQPSMIEPRAGSFACHVTDFHSRLNGNGTATLLWQCNKMATIDEFRSILAKWDKVFVAFGSVSLVCTHE